MNNKILPTKDGKEHINIYSKGRTKLGVMLSNLFHYEFETEFGYFSSIEGYWHFLGLPENSPRHILKDLYGSYAKEMGSNLKSLYGSIRIDSFEQKISKAIKTKFYHHDIYLLEDSMLYHLPFYHYYVFGDRIVDVSNKYRWMLVEIDKIRNSILENRYVN